MNYILKHMKASGEIYDGVFTLVEDHGPITSFIAKELQLPLSPLESATACRSKFLVREAMRRAKLPVPKYAKVWLGHAPRKPDFVARNARRAGEKLCA
jgi:hypothetical protein